MLSLWANTPQMPLRLSVDLMNASITFLPPSVVKSPLWDLTIFMFGKLEMIASKPFLRSMAGAAPTVPCNSTMLQLPLLA